MNRKIRCIALLLALAMGLSLVLTSCKDANRGHGKTDTPETPGTPDVPDTPEDPAEPDEPLSPAIPQLPEEPEEPKAPEEYVYDYKVWPEEELVPWNDVVEHLFFHQIIAYPELAFDGDAEEKGFDDWMVTVSEFDKILDSLYEKGYILVNMNDVWSEYTNDDGEQRMKRNTLMVPKGKKPLVMSIDDTCYYTSYLTNGFMEKLVIGDDGEIWAYGHDPEGNGVLTQDLDIIPRLDKFVKEHPDFSLNGAKACLCLTGYEGIFGYRTNTDTRSWTEEQEAHRLEEVEAVKPIVEQLRRTGWYFGCHTWGHIRLSNKSLESVQGDMGRWMNEVGSIVGDTTLFFYPHGARPDPSDKYPDGNDWQQTGPVFQYLQSLGFRVFASVGTEPFSYIKKDICAVICDRMHPDGKTLRNGRQRYMRFYDAKEVFDYEYRPDYGYDFS